MSLDSEARLPEYNSLVCYRQAGEFGSPRLDRANYLTSSRTTFLTYEMSMISHCLLELLGVLNEYLYYSI